MPRRTINSGSDVAVSTIATPPEARRLLNRAAIVRDEVERYPAMYDEQELLDVDSGEAAALAYLYPDAEPFAQEGGALVPQDACTGSAIRRSPKVAALADNERLGLASEARADELALDMEQSAGAESSIEKAMTHQMAAAHAAERVSHPLIKLRSEIDKAFGVFIALKVRFVAYQLIGGDKML